MVNLSCGNLDLHLSVETPAPLVNPARFVKAALENHSGAADRHSGKTPTTDRLPAGIVITIIPER
jgi:hypothetical protein